MEPSEASAVFGIVELLVTVVVLVMVEPEALAEQKEETSSSLMDEAICTEQ